MNTAQQAESSPDLVFESEGLLEVGSARRDTTVEADDEFDYAFTGAQRGGETHKQVFRPKAAPAHLITNVRNRPLEAVQDVEEEEEEEEENEEEPTRRPVAGRDAALQALAVARAAWDNVPGSSATGATAPSLAQAEGAASRAAPLAAPGAPATVGGPMAPPAPLQSSVAAINAALSPPSPARPLGGGYAWPASTPSPPSSGPDCQTASSPPASTEPAPQKQQDRAKCYLAANATAAPAAARRVPSPSPSAIAMQPQQSQLSPHVCTSSANGGGAADTARFHSPQHAGAMAPALGPSLGGGGSSPAPLLCGLPAPRTAAGGGDVAAAAVAGRVQVAAILLPAADDGDEVAVVVPELGLGDLVVDVVTSEQLVTIAARPPSHGLSQGLSRALMQDGLSVANSSEHGDEALDVLLSERRRSLLANMALEPVSGTATGSHVSTSIKHVDNWLLAQLMSGTISMGVNSSNASHLRTSSSKSTTANSVAEAQVMASWLTPFWHPSAADGPQGLPVRSPTSPAMPHALAATDADATDAAGPLPLHAWALGIDSSPCDGFDPPEDSTQAVFGVANRDDGPELRLSVSTLLQGGGGTSAAAAALGTPAAHGAPVSADATPKGRSSAGGLQSGAASHPASQGSDGALHWGSASSLGTSGGAALNSGSHVGSGTAVAGGGGGSVAELALAHVAQQMQLMQQEQSQQQQQQQWAALTAAGVVAGGPEHGVAIPASGESAAGSGFSVALRQHSLRDVLGRGVAGLPAGGGPGGAAQVSAGSVGGSTQLGLYALPALAQQPAAQAHGPPASQQVFPSVVLPAMCGAAGPVGEAGCGGGIRIAMTVPAEGSAHSCNHSGHVQNLPDSLNSQEQGTLGLPGPLQPPSQPLLALVPPPLATCGCSAARGVHGRPVTDFSRRSLELPSVQVLRVASRDAHSCSDVVAPPAGNPLLNHASGSSHASTSASASHLQHRHNAQLVRNAIADAVAAPAWLSAAAAGAAGVCSAAAAALPGPSAGLALSAGGSGPPTVAPSQSILAYSAASMSSANSSVAAGPASPLPPPPAGGWLLLTPAAAAASGGGSAAGRAPWLESGLHHPVQRTVSSGSAVAAAPWGHDGGGSVAADAVRHSATGVAGQQPQFRPAGWPPPQQPPLLLAVGKPVPCVAGTSAPPLHDDKQQQWLHDLQQQQQQQQDALLQLVAARRLSLNMPVAPLPSIGLGALAVPAAPATAEAATDQIQLVWTNNPMFGSPGSATSSVAAHSSVPTGQHARASCGAVAAQAADGRAAGSSAGGSGWAAPGTVAGSGRAADAVGLGRGDGVAAPTVAAVAAGAAAALVAAAHGAAAPPRQAPAAGAEVEEDEWAAANRQVEQAQWEQQQQQRRVGTGAAAACLRQDYAALLPRVQGQRFGKLQLQAARQLLLEGAGEGGKTLGLITQLLCLAPAALTPALLEQVVHVLCLAKQPYNEEDPLHWDLLVSSFLAFTGVTGALPSRHGAHWAALGWQGHDPATDLRGCGVLGLLQLVSLHDQHPAHAAAMYWLSRDQVHEFPLSIVSLNMTRNTLQVLREGRLNRAVAQAGAVWPILAAFHLGAMLTFYGSWRSGRKTMVQSGFVMKEVEIQCRQHWKAVLRLGLHPPATL